MAELTPETSHNPAVLYHLLDSWRQKATAAGYRRERDKGTAFENLCIAYLQHDPIQARQYEQPMLYADWAQASERRNDRVAEPLGFYAEPERSAQDLGIDLVAKFRAAYGNTVSKRDIFHYIYGLLHVPSYRRRFANNLSKELPRIPLTADPDHFTALVAAGRELGDLHVGFDRVDPWPLEFANGGWDAPADTDLATYFRVQKMKLGGTQKEPDRTTIIYNSNITVAGIPAAAWDYEVNGKPALKWVMERQAVSTDKASGIVNDANRYATETIGDPSYPLKLLACVIRVSTETNRIVKGLPEPEWK